MIKKTAGLLLTAVLMFFSAAGAFAAQIESEDDIIMKAQILEDWLSYDFSNFINKAELIGDRRQNFNMQEAQYKNEVRITQETLLKISKQIEGLKNLNNMNEYDKYFQISKQYQEAEVLLYTLDSKTMTYLYSLMNFMPGITYQRYMKKFSDYYNNLNITDKDIVIK